MFSWITGGLIGAWWASRGKPATKVIKRTSLGGQSGALYTVDEFPEVGMLLVQRKGVCRAVLERAQLGGFVIRSAQGEPKALEALKADFGRKAKASDEPKPE